MGYFPVYPTGWPWPMDAVQDWFEALWEHITSAVKTASRWVIDNIFKPFYDWWQTFFKVLRSISPEGLDAIDSFTSWIPQPLREVARFFLYPAGFLYGLLKPAISGLWNSIKPVLGPVADWIRGAASWLTEGFIAFCKDPLGAINSSVSWVYGKISPYVRSMSNWIKGATSWLTEGFIAFCKDPLGTIGSSVGWVADKVKTMFDGALGTIGEWVSNALSGMGKALGDALQGVVDWFWTQLVPALQKVASILNDVVLEPIHRALQGLWNWIALKVLDVIHGIEALFKGHSPITPEEAPALALKVLLLASGLGLMATGITSVAGIQVLGTGITVGEIGSYVKDLLNPGMIISATLGTLIAIGLTKPLTHHYNKLFRPEIPGASDLVLFLVREVITLPEFKDALAYQGFSERWASAYWDSHWIIPTPEQAMTLVNRGEISEEAYKGLLTLNDIHPDWIEKISELRYVIPPIQDLVRFRVREVILEDDFFTYTLMHALSPEFAEWYWAAHWVLPSIGILSDAHHRGWISREELEKYIIWQDYKPDPRPGISVSDVDIVRATIKTLIPRVDLRYAWEMDQISDEELVSRYEELGYEDDAPLMAGIQKVRALVEEIHKVRDENLKDFIDGLILEETLRANLEALGIGSGRIAYYVEYAKKRRSREHKKALLDIYEDSFVKELLDYDELAGRIAEILVDEEARTLFLDAAYVRKYAKPKGD